MKLVDFIFSDELLELALTVEKDPEDDNSFKLTLKDNSEVEYIPCLFGIDLRLTVLFNGMPVYTDLIINSVDYDRINKFWQKLVNRQWEEKTFETTRQRKSAVAKLKLLSERY